MSHVNAHHQALITSYLHRPQPTVGMANITADATDVDNVPNEEIEDLSDLQLKNIPMDFEGFAAEITQGGGGVQDSGAGEGVWSN